MTMIDIDGLSPPERLALIARLWDSLDASEVPLTLAQEAEIKRRLATLDADMAREVPWEEFEAELDARYR